MKGKIDAFWKSGKQKTKKKRIANKGLVKLLTRHHIDILYRPGGY